MSLSTPTSGGPPPRISILLPAFNAGATLEICLTSILRQSEPCWECIVVDDGSTDSTRDCAREFVRRDPRFRLVARAHEGLVATLNAGLAECRAKYVARMDADDAMHRHRLRQQSRLLDRRPELAGAGCHVRRFPRRELGQGAREYERWLNGMRSADDVRREAFVECPVAHPTLMIRRAQLERLGYRDRGWPEDYDLVLRLLTAGERVGVCPSRLLSWRIRPDSLSRTSSTYSLDRFTACKAAFLSRSVVDGSGGYILWGYGQTGRALRRALAAHDKHPTHIVEVNPRRIGNRIHGAPVIPSAELTRVPRSPILVSVSGAGPRAEIRDELARMGFREVRDFVCTA